MARQEHRRFTPSQEVIPPSPAELTALVNAHLEHLLQDIKAGKTERLTSYLAFSSRFHTYSRRNQALIYEQKPEATRVASYKTWQNEGYQVAKGEKGIRILVPAFPKQVRKLPEREPETASDAETEADQDEQLPEASERAFIAKRFTLGSVFDVSQLTPDRRPPEFFTALHGNYDALHKRLIRVVEQERIVYRESLDTAGAQGYSEGGLIVVRPDQPVGNKAAITTHELAHELLHKQAERRLLSRQVKECHAEATAFVVLAHFGITVPYSAEYLLMWGHTPESLRQELELVRSASSHIITKLHSLEPGEEHFHDHRMF